MGSKHTLNFEGLPVGKEDLVQLGIGPRLLTIDAIGLFDIAELTPPPSATWGKRSIMPANVRAVRIRFDQPIAEFGTAMAMLAGAPPDQTPYARFYFDGRSDRYYDVPDYGGISFPYTASYSSRPFNRIHQVLLYRGVFDNCWFYVE